MRTFTPAEESTVTAMLEDASAHLRDVIGQQVFPSSQASFTVRLGRGRSSVTLPQQPVRSVDKVLVNGAEIEVDSDDVAVYVGCGARKVTVTFTFGYDEPPAELATWACVLASQALSMVEEMGTLGGGGVSSISIDDYRKAWANGGDQTGYSLPRRVEELLQQRYGTAAYVTSERA